MSHGKSDKSEVTIQEGQAKSDSSRVKSQEQQVKSNKSRAKCQEKQVKRDISRVKSIDQLRLVYLDWLPDTEYLRLAKIC